MGMAGLVPAHLHGMKEKDKFKIIVHESSAAFDSHCKSVKAVGGYNIYA